MRTKFSIRWEHGVMFTVSPPQILPLKVKTDRKGDIEAFFSCPILADLSTFYQIFCSPL